MPETMEAIMANQPNPMPKPTPQPNQAPNETPPGQGGNKPGQGGDTQR